MKIILQLKQKILNVTFFPRRGDGSNYSLLLGIVFSRAAKAGLFFLCAGCLLIPTGKPLMWSDPDLFKKERLAFIQVGSTTRQEVLTRLGKPHKDWNNETNILYWGATERAVWLIPVGCGIGGPLVWVDLLLLEFDKDDRVKRYEIKERPGPVWGGGGRVIAEDQLRKAVDHMILEEISNWNSGAKSSFQNDVTPKT